MKSVNEEREAWLYLAGLQCVVWDDVANRQIPTCPVGFSSLLLSASSLYVRQRLITIFCLPMNTFRYYIIRNGARHE